jgi:hypothetical protein
LRSHKVAECISRTSTYSSHGETARFSKSKRLPSVEGLTHRAEPWESHLPDTDSRLLTEMNRAPNLLTAVISTARATRAVKGTAHLTLPMPHPVDQTNIAVVHTALEEFAHGFRNLEGVGGAETSWLWTAQVWSRK